MSTKHSAVLRRRWADPAYRDRMLAVLVQARAAIPRSRPPTWAKPGPKKKARGV